MEFNIYNEELKNLLDIPEIILQKYVASLCNLANQNAQATRPKYVGQLSDMIIESQAKSLLEWEEWYNQQMLGVIDEAAKKVRLKLDEYKQVIENISDDDINAWVYDLIINKTYQGLCIQVAVIKAISLRHSMTYRDAKAAEESKGIDGYIGDIAVQVKPESIKSKPGAHINSDMPLLNIRNTKIKLQLNMMTAYLFNHKSCSSVGA